MARIISAESLVLRLREGRSLSGAAVQNIDVPKVDWSTVDLSGVLFLGCRFSDLDDEAAVRRRGALVFPPFGPLPYEPYRTTLYSPDEMTAETAVGDAKMTRDAAITVHVERTGGRTPPIGEALAQRAHDYAIDAALAEFLASRAPDRVVGVMGGHGVSRAAPEYAGVARLGWLLTDHGYLVVTGGGPGLMEAANLGAYLAPFGPDSIALAVEDLADAPTPDDVAGYWAAGQRVRERFQGGAESLAAPTWVYGDEPTGIFATQIAKYFSNSIREDGLLAIALGGVVFAPGSAGTAQEVFQDAAQNHNVTFGRVSPMVFLGVHHWESTGLYDALRRLAAGHDYAKLITLVDDPADALAFIEANAGA
jgi:predicted Rossmann-fold nucleotide-binding protein